ncbi:MAG: septum formation family protein, partial [Acidimicrobiales bacterium]
LGYRSGALPPTPGASGDLPPGYMTGDARAARRRSERRKGRLMVALGVLIVAAAVLATLAITAKSNKKETVADIDVGECFTGGPNDVETVDCSEPHQFELFAVATAPDPAAAYPGEETAYTDGGNACVMALIDYYGATADVATADGLELAPVAPTEEQWTDGETDTDCLAKDADGDALDASIKGSGAA